MPDRDHYQKYYEDKLWALLPAVYRAEDSDALDKAGPLREMVARIGAQVAIIRRSIDRLWEDQSIETCDDWVIPYIADLLATNLVASLDARGQRLDVAKTIYYRRRKGTVAILEEIASDITGWEARAVEFFRRMGRTRHGLDPALGPSVEPIVPDRLQKAQGLIGEYTRTAMGGFADIRSSYGASKAHSAFDEFAHFADVRPGEGQTGWHNISRLGVFLWRLKSFGVDQSTPVAVKDCPDWYTFDPTGRDIPLFAAASRRETKSYGDRWVSPAEWQLPTPVSDELWSVSQGALYPADALESVRSLSVYTLPGVAGYVMTPPGQVKVCPERGRFKVQNPPVSAAVYASYHYGFSAPIGAGPYDRRARGVTSELPAPVTPVNGGGHLAAAASGTTRIDDSLTYSSASNVGPIDVAAAVVSKNEKRPVIRLAPGETWIFEGRPGSELVLEGFVVSGADILLRGEFAQVTLRSMTLDPGSIGAPPALLGVAADGRDLVPTRLWIEGTVGNLVLDRSITGPIRARGDGILAALRASDSIIQGIRTAAFGQFDAADFEDLRGLVFELGGAHTRFAEELRKTFPDALNRRLDRASESGTISAALSTDLIAALNGVLRGPSLFNAASADGIALSPAVIALAKSSPAGTELVRLNRLLLEEAFPMELADAAIAMPDGETSLSRVTVLGRLNVHRLMASECILDEFAVTEDPQRGCVRFSAWVTGSVLPKQYESVQIPGGAPIFTSRVFGNPGYAQLSLDSGTAIVAPAGASILEGAQNGSEMGAFCSEKNAIKERSLRMKFDEYMPLGLAPVLVYVT